MQKIYKIASRTMCLLISLVLFLTFAAGCTSNTDKVQESSTKDEASTATSKPTEEPAKAEPVNLEYSIFLWQNKPYVQPEKNVVDATIQEKGWNIKVKEYLYESTQNWSEMINLYVAADNMPDIFDFPPTGIDSIAKYADKFYDFTDVLTDPAKIPNLSKRLNPMLIGMMKTFETDRNLYWPTGLHFDFSDPAVIEKYEDDYIDSKTQGYSIYVREDILTKLGYKFKSFAQLEEQMKASNYSQRLTYDDMKIEPEIKTMDDFEKFLTAVRDLNLKAPDGSPVMPYGGEDPIWQLGGAFGFDFFRYIDGKASGNYGATYAKDLFKTLNKWYKMGLLDKDTYLFSKQKDKIAEKVSTGKLACWNGEWVQNKEAAEDNLRKLIPEAYVRYMPVPKYKDNIEPYIENTAAGAERAILVSKKYKDIDNLIKYLDYLWSDEVAELCLWGAESGELWEIKDGKKVFKDESFYKLAIQRNEKTEKNEDKNYYGIDGTSPMTVGLFHNARNEYKYSLSYPSQYEIKRELKRLAGANLACADGTCTSSPKGEAAAGVNDFFWGHWDSHAKLALAKDDAEFEKQWTALMKEFDEKTDYEKAMEDMTKVFKVLTGGK